MLSRSDFLSLNFVKKEDYFGSYKGLRYMLHLEVLEDESKKLKVVIWPEPYCYDATPDEQKVSELFDFSEDGLSVAIDWMNERYEMVKQTV